MAALAGQETGQLVFVSPRRDFVIVAATDSRRLDEIGQNTMPTIQSGEHTIYYRRSQPADAPNAPPLVLIHGAGGTHMHWPGELRRLPTTTVYALDLPGHGQSGGAGCTTITEYAQAVAAWADALGLPRFILAGHSMGGAIAQMVALRQPQRLAGLILVGTGARLAVSPAILDGLGRDYAATARLIAEWAYRRQGDPATLDAYAPVSYTHLDVYKRQRVIWRRPHPRKQSWKFQPCHPVSQAFGSIERCATN